WAADQQHVVRESVRSAHRAHDAGPLHGSRHPARVPHARALVTVVEEVVAADLRELPGLPGERQALQGAGGHVRGVVPALDRDDRRRVLHVEVPFGSPFNGHPPSLRSSGIPFLIHWYACLPYSIRPCWTPLVAEC